MFDMDTSQYDASGAQATIEILEKYERALSGALQKNDSKLLSENLRQLFEYIIADSGLKNIPQICLKHECFPLFVRLRKVFAQAEAQVEKHTAIQMLNVGATDLSSYFFISDYRQLIFRELELLEQVLGPNDNWNGDLVFLGAGALPVSAVLFASQVGRQVICVDIDPEACRLATAIVAGLKMGDRIRIVCRDARTVSLAGSAAVVIASLASPKAEILERIARLSFTPLVLVRSPQAHAAALYETVSDALCERLGFERLGISSAEGDVLHRTVAVRYLSKE